MLTRETWDQIRLKADGIADLPDDTLGRCCWALFVLETEIGIPWATPGEIEKVLLEVKGTHLPRQSALPTLKAARDLVIGRKTRGRIRFKLLDAGKNRVLKAENKPLLVDPGSAFAGRRQVQEIFSGLNGTVRVCDPYVEPASFDFLSKITGSSEIRLLTMNIAREPEFKRDLQALIAQGLPLQVRRVPNKEIHDRYIMDGTAMFQLGTSLNGIGKKQSIIVRLPQDFRDAMVAAFDALWGRSQSL